jgi:predicted GNAT family acetyltransferase
VDTDNVTTDDVVVRDAVEDSRYEVLVDGTVVGFSEYRRYPDRIVIAHTEVDDGLEGRGVASTLVRTMLDEAREQGRRVVASCPYAKAWIARHPDYQDLTR